MTVKIHGKDYKTVAERVTEFHSAYKGSTKSIVTELISWTDKKVVIKATVTVEGSSYTGYAYEIEGSSNINRTSVLENCETSAVGRALAFAGFGGDEIASANEVEQAISAQKSFRVESPKVESNDIGGFSRVGRIIESQGIGKVSMATDKQKKCIFAIVKSLGIDEEVARDSMKKVCGKDATKDLTISEAIEVISYFKSLQDV